MKIEREKIVSRHSPKLCKFEYESPLSVGNGDFVFTVDSTGLQTFYSEYAKHQTPLCTMVQWGWHYSPGKNSKSYDWSDLIMTEYRRKNNIYLYASNRNVGNEHVYDWLRQNPHRANLFTLGLIINNQKIKIEEVEVINQQLDLFSGRIISKFFVANTEFSIITACHPESSLLGIEIAARGPFSNSIGVSLDFSYGDPGLTGAEWNSINRHSTKVIKPNSRTLNFLRCMDDTKYAVDVICEREIEISLKETHCFHIQSKSPLLRFTIGAINQRENIERLSFNQVLESSEKYWKQFWETGAIVDLSHVRDNRSMELERRIILSLYNTAIHSSGTMPPPETGFFCNSWYGKSHLEMHPLHAAQFPLWAHDELLIRSLPWYEKIFEAAKRNAAVNGFRGARWPKMVSLDGLDSPSTIGTFLIWQQPHLIFLLHTLCINEKNKYLIKKYWNLIYETIDFMVDFLEFDTITNEYQMCSPLIPAQEVFDPMRTNNPTFELEYWRYAIKIALRWKREFNLRVNNFEKWVDITTRIAKPTIYKGLYIAHSGCPDTFSTSNKDHPSMLFPFTFFCSERISEKIMKHTLMEVIDRWEQSTLWGWDFALMAMAATRLSLPEIAIDLLLMNSPNNSYGVNGQNRQVTREDLPVYLPGNGSLLLAIPLMVAGSNDGKCLPLQGIPKNGLWQDVGYEGLKPYPS